uniref:Uncharacterized protein n=1 Tax=Anguilla anguilla TaxID=7936 RepID=A0A0E9VC87_ANGAN
MYSCFHIFRCSKMLSLQRHKEHRILQQFQEQNVTKNRKGKNGAHYLIQNNSGRFFYW